MSKKQKIKYLIDYLKKHSHLQESGYLIKIATQINDALDPKPFEIRMPQEIKVLEGMSSDQTEHCQLVNFGINALQKPGSIRRLQQKTPFFKEDINFIHFDLMKLVKCIDINEESHTELKNLLYSLNSLHIGALKSLSKNEFLNVFERFKNVQDAFRSKISDDKMNYILIGTSDKAKNFIGSERGAQLFHQNSINHVVHDLGHASYDVDTYFVDKGSANVGRRKFGPLKIMSEYIVKILEKFEGYAKMVNEKTTLDLDRLKKQRGREEPRVLTQSIAEIVTHLRGVKKFHDIRFLIGTHQNKAKKFTDKSDYDQDIFAYIMLSKTDKVSDIFKDPMIPPTMEAVFKSLPNEKRDEFLGFIQEEHDKMIDLVQQDLEKITEEHGGYVTYLAKEQAEISHRSGEDADHINNVFIFNMMASNLFYIEKALSDRLADKGYSRQRGYSQFHVGDKKTTSALAPRAIIDVPVLSDIVAGQKNEMEGKLLLVSERGSERKQKLLNRFKSLGNYTELKEGDSFFVSETWLKEFARLPTYSFVKELLEVEKTRFDIHKKFEEEETYKATIKFPKTSSDNKSYTALFFPSIDFSRIKTSIQPIDPEKGLPEVNLEKEFFGAAEEEGEFLDEF